MNTPRPAVVVCFSGLDPTGGAGISADIEAITAQGAHCCPLISCHTVQDSRNVHLLQEADPHLLRQQADALLGDIHPAAFKLGALASAPIVMEVARILRQFPEVPVILDPVLAAGGGGSLARQGLTEAIIDYLLPITTLCTPNTLEANALGDNLPEQQAVTQILKHGCKAVLLTGSHRDSRDILHQLYDTEGLLNSYHYPRLAGEYHGSGCTLAAALAARIAQGENLDIASKSALDYSWNSLVSAYSLGKGQLFPNRQQPLSP